MLETGNVASSCIPWLAERISASQQALRSMKL
jgi:hypothetical protein